jgi:hypothetical protein
MQRHVPVEVGLEEHILVGVGLKEHVHRESAPVTTATTTTTTIATIATIATASTLAPERDPETKNGVLSSIVGCYFAVSTFCCLSGLKH